VLHDHRPARRPRRRRPADERLGAAAGPPGGVRPLPPRERPELRHVLALRRRRLGVRAGHPLPLPPARMTTKAPSRSRWLWFGVLAGPVLWGVQLYVNYQWEELEACSPSATHRGVVLGLSVGTWIVLLNTVASAVILAGLAVVAVAPSPPVVGAAGERFWARMAQHVLLMLAAAPLLVAARPGAMVLEALPVPFRARVGRSLHRPGWRAARRLVTNPVVVL